VGRRSGRLGWSSRRRGSLRAGLPRSPVRRFDRYQRCAARLAFTSWQAAVHHPGAGTTAADVPPWAMIIGVSFGAAWLAAVGAGPPPIPKGGTVQALAEAIRDADQLPILSHDAQVLASGPARGDGAGFRCRHARPPLVASV